MRIAIPIDRLQPGRGGIERYLPEVACGLAARGHEVTLLLGAGEAPGGGVRVERIDVPPGRDALGRFARAAAGRIDGGGFDVSLGVGRSLGGDLLQSHGGPHRASRRALLEAGEAEGQGALRRAASLHRPRDRRLTYLESEMFADSRLRAVIALSESSRRDILEVHPAVTGRVRVIPIGVDVGRFPPEERPAAREEVRGRWEVPAGSPLLLFVAHHFRLKGLHGAIETLARLARGGGPSHTLLVVGGGGTGRYRRLAARLGAGDRMRFAGEAERVEPLFLGADGLLHPTFYDPCPHVTLEAWAAGLPVVTTRRNGAAELAPAGSPAVAVVEDPADADALAEATGRLLDPATRDERSEAARAVAESRSLDVHVGEMEALLAEVAEERSTHGAPSA